MEQQNKNKKVSAMKTTKKQQVATRNYRQFYAILKQLVAVSGINADELKADLVSQFTGNRTTSLSDMANIEYSLMIGAMEVESKDKPSDADGDMWRKRVMGAIGGWLTLMGLDNNPHIIKVIACRAAAAPNFNKITISRLRAVYNEFLIKQKIAQNSKILTGIAPINPN